MNNKIGTKIKTNLKKKKISVNDFSHIMRISEEDVQDWIDGTKIPSYKQLVKISSILDIDINKFIDISEINSFLNKKNLMLKICNVIIILLVISNIIFISLYNKTKNIKEDFNIYSFYANGNIFEINEGLFIIHDKEKYIELSDVKLKSKKDIKSLNINISFNDRVWAISEYSNEHNGDIEKWLEKIEYKEFGYPKKGDDSFANFDSEFFPGNMKIEVNYCLTNNECSIDILHIKSKILEPDNRLK